MPSDFLGEFGLTDEDMSYLAERRRRSDMRRSREQRAQAFQEQVEQAQSIQERIKTGQVTAVEPRQKFPTEGFAGLRYAEQKMREHEAGEETVPLDVFEKTLNERETEWQAGQSEWERARAEVVKLDPRIHTQKISEWGDVVDRSGKELREQRARLDEDRLKLQEHKQELSAFENLVALIAPLRAYSGGGFLVSASDPAYEVETASGERAAWPKGPETELLFRMRDEIGLRPGVDLEAFFDKPENVAAALEWAKANAPEVAKAAEKAAELAGGPPSRSAIGSIVGALRGPVLANIGFGTLAAEGLAKIVGAPAGKMITDPSITGEKVSALEAGAHAGTLSLSGLFTDDDTGLKKRGQAFLDMFGETAAIKGWSPDQLLMRIPVWVPGPHTPARLSAEAINRLFDAGIGEGGATSAAIASGMFEFTFDPLWAVGWGGKMAQAGRSASTGWRSMAAIKAANEFLASPSRGIGKVNALTLGRAGRALMEKNPAWGKMFLAPEKSWLWLTAHPKEAAVLGDDGMEAVLKAERAFREGAGQDAYKLAQEHREVEAALFARLDLTPEQVAQTRHGLFEIGEMPSGQRRRMAITQLTDDGVVRHALDEAADLYGDATAKQLAHEGRWGLAGKALEDDTLEYVAREFTPKLQAHIKRNPSARQLMTGERGRISNAAFQAQWRNFEKTRKFREMPVAEVEAELAKMFEPTGYKGAIFKRDLFEQLAIRAERNIAHMTRRHLWASMGTVFGKQLASNPQLDFLVAQASDAKMAAALRGALEASDNKAYWLEVLDGLVDARHASRQALKAGQREAASAPQAAQAAADIGSAPKDLRASLKVKKDLRKMFPGAADIADDAEDAMRGMAQAVSERVSAGPTARSGTILSRDAQRRANEATERFYAAYQGATNTKGYRAAVRMYSQELANIVPPAMVKDFTKRAQDALKQLDRLEKAQAAVAKPVVSAVRSRARAATMAEQEAAERVPQAHVADWTPEAKAKWVDAVTQRAIRDGELPAIPTGHVSALDVMRANKVKLPEDIASLARLAATYISPDDMRKFTRYMDEFHAVNALANNPDEMVKRAGAVLETLARVKQQFQRMYLSVLPGAMVDMIHTTLTHAMFLGGVTPQWFDRARKALGGTMEAWAKGPGVKARGGWHVDDEMLYMINEGILQGIRRAEAEAAELSTSVAREGMSAVEKRGLLAAGTEAVGKIPGARSIPGFQRVTGAAADVVQKLTDFPMHARVYAEELSRAAMFLQKRAKGMTRHEAGQEVIRHFGKVNELGRWEKAANHGFFFWMWRRNSIPITLRSLLDKPVRSRVLATAMAGDQEDPTMPEWARRAGGPSLGMDGHGNVRMWGLSNGTWFAPTASLLESDFMAAVKRADVLAAATEGGKEFARSMPPHLKAAVQQIAQYDFFTDRSWYEDGEQTTRAPIGMYHLMASKDHPEGKEGALEKFLNLKPVRDRETGQIRYLTMDPTKKNLMEAMGALGPMMTWASAFLDPRAADVGEGVSLVKGLGRTLGFPIISVPPRDIERDKVREMRSALREDLRRVGTGLRMDDFGNVVPDENQPRGQQLKEQVEGATQRAADKGAPQGSLRQRALIEQEMLHTGYYSEWMLIEMGRRLRHMNEIAKGDRVLQRKELPKPREFSAHYTKQSQKERERELRERFPLRRRR